MTWPPFGATLGIVKQTSSAHVLGIGEPAAGAGHGATLFTAKPALSHASIAAWALKWFGLGVTDDSGDFAPKGLAVDPPQAIRRTTASATDPERPITHAKP